MSKIQTHIKEAVKIQKKEGTISEKALHKYKEAIAAYNNDDDEYELLYATYQIMYIYCNLDQIGNALPYAKKCLALLEKTLQSGTIFHFSDMGKFQEEVIRYATNVVAWYAYEHTNDIDELEEALETICLGCNYVKEPVSFYVFDTKVRILLKLERKEEAFRIVYNCLKKYRDFRDFRDIKSDKEYIEWKENFEAGIVKEYSEEERAFLEKAARITTKLRGLIAESEKYSEQFPEVMPEKEMVLMPGIIQEKYNIEGSYSDIDYMLLFKGDVHIKGNLDRDWFEKQLKGIVWKNNLWGMVIDGNLKVDGDITIDEAIDVAIFCVAKDLVCDYLYSGNGHMKVKGNAHVKYGIYGYYNDGSLDISGKLTSPYNIADDHDMSRESDEGEFIYIEGGNGDEPESIGIGKSLGSGIGWNWDYFEDSAKLFSKTVWDENNNFSVDQFFDIVKKGDNPFIEIK